MAKVNLVAPTLCCRLAVKAMAAAGEGGRWGRVGRRQAAGPHPQHPERVGPRGAQERVHALLQVPKCPG